MKEGSKRKMVGDGKEERAFLGFIFQATSAIIWFVLFSGIKTQKRDTQKTSAIDVRRSSSQDVVDSRVALAPSSFSTPNADSSGSGGSRNVGDDDSDEVRSSFAAVGHLVRLLSASHSQTMSRVDG